MISRIGAAKASKADLGSGGFTLIEILLVTIIMGIVLVLAVPNFFKGYTRFQINKTSDDLLTVSRWAQAMAIGQERMYALSFSGDRRSYNLVRVKVPLSNEAAGIDGQDSFEPVKGTLGRMHTIPDAIHMDTDKDRIEFHPDGTIDPVTIRLATPEQKTVISSTEVRGMMTKVDRE